MINLGFYNLDSPKYGTVTVHATMVCSIANAGAWIPSGTWLTLQLMPRDGHHEKNGRLSNKCYCYTVRLL